jgi:O-antigen/teichoic acid export membrane protein
MAVVILLSGNIFLGLFGPEFAAGYPLLFILVIGIIARATVGPAESVLTMSGHHNVCVLIYSVSLALNVALNLTLIPRHGLAGAAWATTCAMMFEAAALYVVVHSKLGIHMFILSRRPQLPVPSAKAGF